MEDDSLRIAWDNRTAPKQNGLFALLVVFWLVWAPVTIYMSGVILHGETPLWFGIVFFVLGWLGTIGIPMGCLGRWRSESFVITANRITYGAHGLLALRPTTYPIKPEGPKPELVFGYFPSRVATDQDTGAETMITLSLIVRSMFGMRRRILIGYWLAPSLKEKIFTTIESYVTTHKIPVLIKRHGT
jgi:hypothetical protein